MNRSNRRTFLKHSAPLTSATLLAPRSSLLAARPLAARGVNEKLNLGFIGLGGRSKELLPLFTKLPDVRIAALCDVDQERLDAAAKEHKGAKKFGDLRKLLDDR